MAALTSDVFRWHFYDQRGSGRSTHPFTRAPAGGTWKAMQAIEASLGLAEQIADIERIRRLLGKESLVLVGHSFGALVAALYAAEWPERVAALMKEIRDVLDEGRLSREALSEMRARLAEEVTSSQRTLLAVDALARHEEQAQAYLRSPPPIAVTDVPARRVASVRARGRYSDASVQAEGEARQIKTGAAQAPDAC